jgi:uncharacterized membrane protein YfcA
LSADSPLVLAPAVFLVALLYSSVGHAGASGYIAVLALASVPPAVIKPTALVLNVLVATLTSLQFWRAGHFSWPLFWPFALLAVPLAFLGGSLTLPTRVFQVVVGLVLLFSAARFLLRPPPDEVRATPSRPVAIGAGGALGLLAGLTGTGGGIFLTPLLLFLGWARAKQAAAASALFILVNSIAGLAGNASTARSIPALSLALAAAALAGGAIGSYLGSRRFDPALIKRLLAAVLTVAGLKLVLGA